MKQRIHQGSWAAAAIAAFALAAPAAADEFEDAFGGLAALGEEELALERGGADVVMVQEATLSASVSGNSVGKNVQTGVITFQDSFTGNSGIQSSLVNTGNNVSMQSSMTVNIYLD